MERDNLTAQQLASVLGWTRNYVYIMTRREAIPVKSHRGIYYRYDLDDVLAVLEGRVRKVRKPKPKRVVGDLKTRLAAAVELESLNEVPAPEQYGLRIVLPEITA